MGRIVQVNISKGGVPKRPVLRGYLSQNGLEGDWFAHPQIHGGALQAVLLISGEVIEELRTLGYPVYSGALGENFTTAGLNHKQWRSGQQFRVGTARIELTKLRVPCRALDIYGKGRDSVPIQKFLHGPSVKRGDTSAGSWGRSGFYARVVQPGEVVAGDTIVLESELA